MLECCTAKKHSDIYLHKNIPHLFERNAFQERGNKLNVNYNNIELFTILTRTSSQPRRACYMDQVLFFYSDYVKSLSQLNPWCIPVVSMSCLGIIDHSIQPLQ